MTPPQRRPRHMGSKLHPTTLPQRRPRHMGSKLHPTTPPQRRPRRAHPSFTHAAGLPRAARGAARLAARVHGEL
eukprot:362261-Chlamydomonas_euryale.AAC.5